MDLLKALKRTTILSATAMLALGAAEAYADTTAALGHMSASIASTLAIAELSPMSFGNMTSPAGAATVTMDPDGTLSTVTGTTMLYGADSTPTAGLDSGSGAQETAAQAPGFFSIVTDSPTKVYVTFADSNGNIIDAEHPANNVVLANSTGDMTVDSFTFSEDTGAATPTPGDGYSGTASATDPYGSYITVTAAGDRMRVGATLHFAAGGEAVGQYTGSYYVMVSY